MSRQGKIIHLQMLRAIAASAVVATHAGEYPIRRGILAKDYYPLVWCPGWIGVATFFVISGLIMMRSAGDDYGSGMRALRFTKRRLIRIVPLYWLVTIPAAAAALARGETLTIAMVLKSLLFIPYFSVVEGAMRPIAGLGWTLNFEALFYLVFACSLVLPRRIGLPILLLFFPSIVIARSFVWPLVPYADAASLLQFWTDPISLLFVIGVVIGLVESHLERPHRVGYPITLSMLLFVGAAVAFIAEGGSFPLSIGWQALFGVCGCLAVILCTSAREPLSGPFGNALVAAGDASYSIYLTHPIVLKLMALVWDHIPAQKPALFVLLALVLCNAAGYAVFRLVEQPLTRSLRERTETRLPVT